MRIPIYNLFEDQISKGLVNRDKLEQKVAAFLEFVNSDLKAFDIKSGKNKRMKFNDCVVVHYMDNGKKIKVIIDSPRFENGQYVAEQIFYGSGVLCLKR